MIDGSQYTETNEKWVSAINTRESENDDWINQFKSCVAHHWDNRTIPSKFNEDIPWEKKYKNHSELAPDVIYPYIRAIVMGLIFKELDSQASVLALNDDGSVSEYPEKSN